MNGRRPQPTLAQLRAFVAVAERLHFGSAAAYLGVSQPSLSQALASLESAVGIRLVDRTSRRVTITAQGLWLLPRARRTVEAADRFVASAAGCAQRRVGSARPDRYRRVAR